MTITKKNNLEHNKETTFYHLIEEVGELSSELYAKKNGWRREFNKENFDKEVIDVIIQLLILAYDHEVDIEETFKNKISEFRERFNIN